MDNLFEFTVNLLLQGVFKELYAQLVAWQNVTQDPWICGLNKVLEDKGSFKDNPRCFTYLV